MSILEAFLWIAAPFGIFPWIGQKNYGPVFSLYCWQFITAEAATWTHLVCCLEMMLQILGIKILTCSYCFGMTW